MQEAGCRRIVFSSSATVYGMNNLAPFKEGMPTSATNPYGYTKVMIEQILTDLAASIPCWSVSLLRYFNPIGAHPSGLLGEAPTDSQQSAALCVSGGGGAAAGSGGVRQRL